MLQAGRLEILVFELAEQRYALPLAEVRAVHRAVTIARLPHGPSLVEGVVDVHGTLIPVMDVRRRLGLAAKAVEVSDFLVVADAGTRTVALRVDHVQWIVKVDPLSVDHSRDLIPDLAYVAGIAKLPDGLVLIHDLRQFLSAEEESALTHALGSYRRVEAGE